MHSWQVAPPGVHCMHQPTQLPPGDNNIHYQPFHSPCAVCCRHADVDTDDNDGGDAVCDMSAAPVGDDAGVERASNSDASTLWVSGLQHVSTLTHPRVLHPQRGWTVPADPARGLHCLLADRWVREGGANTPWFTFVLEGSHVHVYCEVVKLYFYLRSLTSTTQMCFNEAETFWIQQVNVFLSLIMPTRWRYFMQLFSFSLTLF